MPPPSLCCWLWFFVQPKGERRPLLGIILVRLGSYYQARGISSFLVERKTVAIDKNLSVCKCLHVMFFFFIKHYFFLMSGAYNLLGMDIFSFAVIPVF